MRCLRLVLTCAGLIGSAVLSGRPAPAAVVVDDPLAGSTIGTRSGGEFVGGGWKITGKKDYIYWHLPSPVTCGAVEFNVKGLIPRDPPEKNHSDNNLFEMYDYTFENADRNYMGFRNNPCKMRLNKSGPDYDYRGLTDSCQVTWIFPPDDPEHEWDTSVLSWSPDINYKFRVEWGPASGGYSPCKILRNGVVIWQRNLAGTYNPSGHSVRLGWSTRDPDVAPLNAVFSNLKVYALQPSVPGAPTITLGSQKQLFLDDYLVASMTNVNRRVHPAEKHQGNPVIWKTESWEDPFNVVYGSVIHDGDKYKVWYQSGYGVSYAESDDGITWTKPRLDLMVIDGQKTNVLFRKKSETTGSDELPYFQELFGVTKDPRETDPSRRYKMCTLSIDWNYAGGPRPPNHLNQLRGVGVAGSPDGIHWKIIDSFSTVAICDGATHWMFDPALQKYVLFGRTLKRPPEIEAAWSKYDWYRGWYSGRAVGRIESNDLVKWNLTETGTAPVVMTPDLQDEPGTEIYSMNVFPYESAYIGLLQVYLSRPDACVLNVQLVTSRDGVRFTRVGDRSSIISVGPVGSWERFNTSLANNPPIPVGDDLRIYYGNRLYRHSPYEGKDTSSRTGGIGFATVKRDRFVSLEASFDGGVIVTKPLKLEGKTLHLNAKSDYGEIVVEVLDSAGKHVSTSRPICRDSLDIVAEWDGDPPGKANGPVVLRITLKNACLYALWCS